MYRQMEMPMPLPVDMGGMMGQMPMGMGGMMPQMPMMGMGGDMMSQMQMNMMQMQMVLNNIYMTVHMNHMALMKIKKKLEIE